jgi:hypothetical protein
MPLYTSFGAAGDGSITEKSSSIRNYQVGEQSTGFANYTESIITETREWVGLTKEAAIAQVNANVQPPVSNATYSWSMQLANLITRAYSVQRIFERRI